jgi:acyl-coenzyme A synthetase/AMP-(fatty) acid ligase
MEIYGCTEAGSMATRRTSLENDWTPYPGLTFSIVDGQTLVRAAHLLGDVPVTDHIELRDGGRIRLLGRDTDMIKIGGRRGSLANIGAKLAALPGVIDQAVFMVGEGETARPAALVVAPDRDASTLRQDLSQMLDAVFVPRPLKIVSALPRNELGKLPRESLMKLLRE